MSITAKEIYAYFEEAIPSSLSQEWDNDGAMVLTNPDKEIKKALFALDATSDCVDYAVKNNFDLIITHHPIIFKPIKNLTDKKLVKLVKNDISVFSFHTRLDALDGGVNDRLCEKFGITDTEKFAGGCGRIGRLECINDIDIFTEKIKKSLGCAFLRTKLACDTANTVAVVSGGGGEFFREAFEMGADTFISGEVAHHEFIGGYELGMNMIEAGHDKTEEHIVTFFTEIFAEKFPDIYTEEYYEE